MYFVTATVSLCYTLMLSICTMTIQLTEEKQVLSTHIDTLKAEAESVKEQLTEVKSMYMYVICRVFMWVVDHQGFILKISLGG